MDNRLCNLKMIAGRYYQKIQIYHFFIGINKISVADAIITLLHNAFMEFFKGELPQFAINGIIYRVYAPNSVAVDDVKNKEQTKMSKESLKPV